MNISFPTKITFAVTVIFLYIFTLGLAPSIIFAQQDEMSTASQMLNLSLKDINVQNTTVTGSINFSNDSIKNFAEAYTVTKLISPGEMTTIKANGQSINKMGAGQLIEFAKSEYFSVTPGQKFDRPLELKFPSTVKPGKYKLIIEIKDKDNTSQGVVSQEVEISGSGTFVDIAASDCSLKVGNTPYNMVEGPNVPTNQTATVTCTVRNKTPQSITAKPQVLYAVNSVSENMDQAKTFDLNSSLTIGAGKSGIVTITIPKDLTPQVYEGLLTLVDTSNQKMSPSIPFRWIETGASAVINNVDLDRSYYIAGQNAKISISALPSMDLSWRGGPDSTNPGFQPNAGTDLKNAKVTLKVLNADNQTCGTGEQELPATTDEIYWKNIQAEVPITIECKDPKVEAAIIEEGIVEPLAVLTKGVKTTYQDLHPETNVAGSKLGNWLWGILGLLIVAAGVAGYFIWKKKRKTPPTSPPKTEPVRPVQSTVTPTLQNPSVTTTAALLLILVGGIGALLFSQNKLTLQNPMTVSAQQQFSVIQGVAKTPANNTDDQTKTVTMQKHHDRVVGGPRPLQWANVRDFAENNTGGDSHITADAECKNIQITVNGTANSDYMCANWGPGIAIANFVDGVPAIPNNLSSALENEVIIPSIEIPNAGDIYNDASAYGPHILNVYNLGVIKPKSVSYTLNFPEGLSQGQHKVLLQAGVAQTTIHASWNRFYSSLETVVDAPGQLPDFNCDGKSPCFINLEHTITCGPPPVCNQSCTTKDDCEGAKNGCVDCRPNEEGQNVCQPPPLACNATCSDSKDCFGNKEGCTSCEPNAAGTGKVCAKPPVCGAGCVRDDQCAGAVKDGCTVCLPSGTGAGKVCSKPPACGNSCTRDDQCAGAVKDGCTICESATPGGPGTCMEPFDPAACKCDGFNAINISNPSQGNFKFEAYGKVEGKDITKAKIESMTFTLYKSSKANPDVNVTKVATSQPITPTIIASESGKIRYRAEWSVTPPAYDPNAIYRVGATPKCIRAKSPVTAAFDFNGAIYNSDNSKVLGQELNYTPARLAQGNDNLELGTLKDGFFTRIKDTDSCSFLRFEYGQY